MWIIIILTVLFLLVYMKLEGNAKKISKTFADGNVIVFGKKGKGKDLLFQKVIRKRKEGYFSNIPYGYKHNDIGLKDISVEPNTYLEFIDNQVKKIPYIGEYHKKDFYISDGGVYLPSQYDSKLDKKYPSMPIAYALSRHLWENNIHVNTQNLGRLWKKLREQADYYYKALKTRKIFGLVFTKVRAFEEYETADKNLLPMKKKIFDKQHNALKAQHDATYGEINDMWIVQRASKIAYDTHYFRNVVFEREDLLKYGHGTKYTHSEAGARN